MAPGDSVELAILGVKTSLKFLILLMLLALFLM